MARYQKLRAGDPVTRISASAYNEMIDMLQWWRSAFRTGGGPVGGTDYDQGVFLAKNETGGNLAAYSVVGIGGPLITPTDNLTEFKNRTPLSVVTPDIDAHASAFGVALDICGTGAFVRVCVSGLVPVLLDVTNEDDTSAGIDDGETTHLVTGGEGVPIVWKDAAEKEDGNGHRWGLVLLGGKVILPPGTTTNDILRWEADESGSSSSGEGGRWVIHEAPSDEGEWVLAVVEGVMQWREVKPFTCGDESSGS